MNHDLTYYTCNICGVQNEYPTEALHHRELINCISCGCCARFRGIARVVQERLLYNTTRCLGQAWPRKTIKGIGISDDLRYSCHLERLFEYTNTFFHTEPRLDITTQVFGSPGEWDFIICSEVLEHVLSPVSASLLNLNRMLRLGGTLILSTPYLDGYESIEHFPHLHQFTVDQIDDRWIVSNTRRDGMSEQFQDPIFHGGPGATLEMRVFGEGDLFSLLFHAGFHVQVYEPKNLECGFVWNANVENPLHGDRKLKSYILAATKNTNV